MTMSECCISGFQWDATPIGTETTLQGRKTYVTGSSSSVAILILHDLFGWTFKNTRILADHYSKEVGATVYVPDFFGGEGLPTDILLDEGRWGEVDVPGHLKKNTKEIRGPEMFDCAKALRSEYHRVGAIGFCYGGWAAFQLGAKDNGLVDCISVAHPIQLTKDEIQKVGVPVQILAPEFDPLFTEELKAFSNQVIPTLSVPYDYQFFPGVQHAFAARGDPAKPGERKSMERAKNAAVLWFRQWLLEEA